MAWLTNGTSVGSRPRTATTPASSAIGLSITGPTPGLISTPTPIARSGTTMSLNKMAASTPYRRTGCSVISVIISGLEHASSIGTPARTFRYSGSDRPAWRMNHTGACETG